ncbi:MAG: pyridoxine 5'-phosphate synthase [Bacteroidia bacterium]|nr:pyridoxine 5'-phosphate synthase [Bacteroidia bacterium]
MVHLSVNINKIALIRNSRGHNLPDVLQVAQDCIRFGADGITVHPRPDERHVRRQDVYDLKAILSVELNVEGYPSESFLRMIEEVQPAQATLVPDPPQALTSNAGWDTVRYKGMLAEITARIQAAGVRTSLFVAPDLEMIEAAREIGADRIELYTEAFAAAYDQGDPAAAVEPYARSAAYAHALGLGVNAGHDLNLRNLAWLAQHLPMLDEVSIGHALVCDALYLGLEETIRRYQGCLGK